MKTHIAPHNFLGARHIQPWRFYILIFNMIFPKFNFSLMKKINKKQAEIYLNYADFSKISKFIFSLLDKENFSLVFQAYHGNEPHLVHYNKQDGSYLALATLELDGSKRNNFVKRDAFFFASF